MFVNKTKLLQVLKKYTRRDRDLSKQFWCPVDGQKYQKTKKTLFSDWFFKLSLHKISSFIKYFIKYIGAELACKLAYKISLQSFFNFKLFMCSLDAKRPKCFKVFIPLNPHQGTAMYSWWSLQYLETPTHILRLRKLDLSSKVDISKTAWINTWPIWAKVMNILPLVNWFIFGKKMTNTLEMSSFLK